MFCVTSDNKMMMYDISNLYELNNTPIFIFENSIMDFGDHECDSIGINHLDSYADFRQDNGTGRSIRSSFLDATRQRFWIISSEAEIKYINIERDISCGFSQFNRIIQSVCPSFDEIKESNICSKITYWCPRTRMNLLTYCLLLKLYYSSGYYKSQILVIDELKEIFMRKKSGILRMYALISNISFLDIQVVTLFLCMFDLEMFILDFIEIIFEKQHHLFDSKANVIIWWVSKVLKSMGGGRGEFDMGSICDFWRIVFRTMFRKTPIVLATEELVEKGIVNCGTPRSAVMAFMHSERQSRDFLTNRKMDKDIIDVNVYWLRDGYALDYPDIQTLCKYRAMQEYCMHYDPVIKDPLFSRTIDALWDHYKTGYRAHSNFRAFIFILIILQGFLLGKDSPK
jgi:hypothetical protein